jgi:hypothetical protein
MPRRSILSALAGLLLIFTGCNRTHRESKPLGPDPVDFVYWNRDAKKVFLAGSFNGWNTTSTPMQRTEKGEWHAHLTLKPGRHQYKFIADGHWTQDPANSESAPDLFGGKNSVIVVNPGAHQDGMAERRLVAAASRRLLEEQDFATIEKQANELRRSKRKLRQGRWELQPFYEGLDFTYNGSDDPDKWRKARTLLDAWHKQFPESITEPVVRAHTLINYAWDARGTGWAREVPEEGWKQMRTRLKEARDVLEAAAKLPARCPEWYDAMQNVALGQVWTRKEFDQLFEEAVKFEPSYYSYYFNKAYYLTPRWYGRYGEWEDFAADAATRYDSKEGQALYARIAWSKNFLFGNIFRESRIRWPRMREGFDDILGQYPHSLWNLNNYAFFACKARDRDTATRLFEKIGEDFDYDVWHSQNQFAAAKRWAATNPNSPSVQPQYRQPSHYTTRASALATTLPDQRYYAGYNDGVLDRWDPTAGRSLARIAKFDSGILDIAVAPNGKLIAVALDEKNQKSGTVKIVDDNGAEKATIGEWDAAPRALAFSADGSQLVMVGGRGFKPGIARMWDAQAGTVTPISWPTPRHLLITAALSPDGRLLMTNDDKNVRVWDLQTNKFIFQMSKDTAELVQDVAFSPDGKLAAVACSRDSWESDAPGLLIIWNTTDWSEAKRIPLDCGARYLRFSPDNRYLAAARRDNSVGLYKTSDWKFSTEFLPMSGYISGLTYAPDGKSIAIATFDDGFSTWQLPP